MRPLPLSACHTYTPNDFDPGYKYHLLTKSKATCLSYPQTQYEPGDEFKAQDNDCIRLSFRGLELKRDCTFRLFFGWGTSESFNRAIKLLDGKLLDTLQASQQTGDSYIEFEDTYLYDPYSDYQIQPLTGGRYVLQSVNIDCVWARLEMIHKVSVIEVRGRYSCLEHLPRYREIIKPRLCLN